jgi:hypothetical protein
MWRRLRKAAQYLRIPVPWQWSTAFAIQNSNLWQRLDTACIPGCSAVPLPRQYCLVSILQPDASGLRVRRSLREETPSKADKQGPTTGLLFAKPIAHETTLPSHCLSYSHSHLHSHCRCNHHLRGFLHGCAHLEVQARLLENLPALFNVSAFEAQHNRNLHVQLLRRSHHAGS